MAGFTYYEEFAQWFVNSYGIDDAKVTTKEFDPENIDPENVSFGYIGDSDEVYSTLDIKIYIGDIVMNMHDKWVDNDFEILRKLIIERGVFVTDRVSGEHGGYMSLTYPDKRLVNTHMLLTTRKSIPKEFTWVGIENYNCIANLAWFWKDSILGSILRMDKVPVIARDREGKYLIGGCRKYYSGVTDKTFSTLTGKAHNYMLARDHLLTLNEMSKENIPAKIKVMTFLVNRLRDGLLPDLAEIVLDYVFI